MNEFDNGNDLLASMLSELNSDADSSPVGATVEPKPPEEIEQLDNFSYDGYQVVRREFFAHIQEPSITFSNFKVYVNQICVNKLPDVEFVQMLVNSDTKILAIRPCEESDRDSFPWAGKGEKLNELSPIILQQFVTELMTSGNKKTGEGLSASTVNGIITVIQNSLQTAYNLGYIQNDVSRKIKRPRLNEKQVTCFTIAEQKQIEQEVLQSKKPKMKGILICLYTGLRIGELLALEWTDIDFSKEELSITKTCFDGKDKNGLFCRITNTPKTDTSIRVIPIPKKLIPILKDMKKSAKNQYLISDSEKTLAVRSYQRSFERLLIKLGIPKKGFHALRHTFATRALEVGVDVKTLSEILGHKNANVTLQRYAHSMPEHKKEMMNRVGKLL